MKILTIGASPYLLVRNGKIHADVINRLIAEGHEVSSAVWHHDEGYFMPSEEGIHSYEKDGKAVCQLYPFTPKTNEASPVIYELMKTVQPQLVITVGDYKDTNFLFAIKAMYPTLFKWVAIYTFDSQGIDQNNKDAFEYTDYIFSTSEFGWKELSSFANVRGKHVPYGPDHSVFKANDKIEKTNVLCSSRNAQGSNIAAFIAATAETGIKPYLHTNFYDPGDYSIESLKTRYKAESLEMTEDYCSIKDGISEEKLCEIYNKSCIIVDCSIKSATALSLLEGMGCGCVPVGPSYGRIGEIISQMPEGLRFTIPYNIFVGQNEEEFAIISSVELRRVLLEILSNPTTLKEASSAAIEVSKRYSNNKFLDELVESLEQIQFDKQLLSVDFL